MQYRKTVAALAALLLATASPAGQEKHMNLSIAVIDEATNEEVRVDLDGESLGFDLEAMQVGENRAVVDENGQNVLITREEDGYRFDVDGKTVRAPLHHEADDGEYDVVVRAAPFPGPDGPRHAPPRPPLAPGGPGTTIISSEPIDDETQQAIEDLLKAAGHDADIRFIDAPPHGGGRHEVRIVEKRIEKRAGQGD